jgi:hypothetical protein
LRGLRCDLALLRHGLEGKKRQHLVSSTILSPVSRSASLSLFSFTTIGKEVRRRWEVLQEDVGSCKGGCQLYSPAV